MRTLNGQLVAGKDGKFETPFGTFFTFLEEGEPLNQRQLKFLDDIYWHFDPSRRLTLVTEAQKEFIELMHLTGIQDMINSLKMIHDLALYHTDVYFDTPEKNALFNLKVLWEGLERMERG